MNRKYAKSLKIAVLAIATVAFVAVGVVKAEDEVKVLKLGDPAPALQVAEWLQGGPIALNEGKGSKIYVVEFWATWCPPCRVTIPHLTELYKKYKGQGLEVVAITDEDPEYVKEFLTEQGDKLAYPVAIDRDQLTAIDYMLGVNVNTIPHAFVIDAQGKLVWHGSPLNGLEEAVKQHLPKKDKAPSRAKAPSGNEV
ncbi:MAG: TlpA family protein disulfide reductase [Candidatus Hydrogenedentes bacterium]|nr:TlpA family protein disulfide reductase [Candidatus Hydrogenedentota bacterium]